MPEKLVVGWVKPVGVVCDFVGKKPGFYVVVFLLTNWFVESLVGFGQVLRSFIQSLFHALKYKFISVSDVVFHAFHTTNNKLLFSLYFINSNSRSLL